MHRSTGFGRMLSVIAALVLIAAACGGDSSGGAAGPGAWDSGQLCDFVDSAAVNAAAGRDDLEAEEIDWGNDDAGCKWPGPTNSAFNPDLAFWMQQSTETEPSSFHTENELGIPGADVSWSSAGLDGDVPLDASFTAYVGDQRLSIEPGFEYDDGALSALAQDLLTEWVAIQAGTGS